MSLKYSNRVLSKPTMALLPFCTSAQKLSNKIFWLLQLPQIHSHPCCTSLQ